MILFEKDWQDAFPHAIIDTKTDNTSFLRYAGLLKTMGIKNNAFVLQLHDKELQGIDPFSSDVYNSQELMMRIALECRNNFFYFIRQISRDPNGSPEYPLRFRANRGNISLYWLFFNHITMFLIQIRQTGKSFSCDVLMTYLLNIRCKKTEINLLTKDETLRSSNLERLKKIESELPFYLKQRTRADIGSQEELSIKSLGNRYRGHLPQKSPKMALNVGRGLTSPIFQGDEIAFLPNIELSLPAALAAGTAARDIAARNGDPYGTLFTTTAGKKDDRDGKFIYQKVQDAAIWTEKFFDCKNIEELENVIRKSSVKGVLQVNCTFNHRQLGYTDEWLKNAVEAANAVGEAAERDFGNVWTSGSIMSPLTPQLADMIRASEESDYYTEISSPYSYITRWYVPETSINAVMQNTHHILSADTSDAVGGDDIGLTLRNIKTGAVVAAGNYNETNLITFSEWLCEWFVRFPNFTLIIERRSTGAMIIDYLLMMLPAKGIDPFKRIYNKVVQEAEEFPDRFKEISRSTYGFNNELYVKHKKTFGFATSATGATSRTELYSTTLVNAAKLTGDKVKDKKTIDQILGLIIKNGRVDHSDTGHDDLCISWCMSFWLLSMGKNLHYYGINVKDILVDNKQSQVENNPISKYDNYYQNQIKSKIEFIVEELKKERDLYLVQRYESEVKSLSYQLSEQDRQTLSVDELINNLKEFRRMNSFGYRR